jgi:ABC-2 type transport system permease protein
LAVVERDMRKFRRSPALLVSSLMLPLLQLIILGNAFGGNIKNVIMGVVNLDHGPQSVDVLERVRAVGANARTFLPTDYADQGAALNDLRRGKLGGVLIIPEHYSRDLLERHQPHLALITDNTDRSVAGAIGAQMSDLTASISAPQVPPREPQQAALDVVEVYPYIDYMKYLLPGSVALAVFMTAMIAGCTRAIW